MTALIELKEKLKEIYGSASGVILPVLKFLLGFLVFWKINETLGYWAVLNNIYVVLILALLCALLPFQAMAFFSMIMILGHCFALHIVVAGTVFLVLAALWFLYLRFAPKDALALILTPLAFWLRVPVVVPVGYALTGTPLSAVSVSCGIVVYYLCELVRGKMDALLHAAEEPQVQNLIQEFFNGLFRNEEMLLSIIACAIVVLLVCAIRHSSADYAWQIAVVTGAVAYAVIMIAGGLALDVEVSLPVVLSGTAAGAVIGFLLQFFLFGADYTRTEHLEFEDDDYHYYVKAVPKYSVTKAERKVTYIQEEQEEKPKKEKIKEKTKIREEKTASSENLQELEELEQIIEQQQKLQEEKKEEGKEEQDEIDYKSALEDTLKDL